MVEQAKNSHFVVRPLKARPAAAEARATQETARAAIGVFSAIAERLGAITEGRRWFWWLAGRG
jgi:hypothetical protein